MQMKCYTTLSISISSVILIEGTYECQKDVEEKVSSMESSEVSTAPEKMAIASAQRLSNAMVTG
jgi:hypothetical protein